MGEALIFYLFAACMLAGAACVVTTRHPTYAVLSLVVAMFFLAAVFVLLKAYFVAVVHLLVYAGAILVLFLFVIMLLGLEKETRPVKAERFYPIVGGCVTAGFFLALGTVALNLVLPNEKFSDRVSGTIEAVGKLLFSQYLLPFEITSFLILVGIVGAVALAKKETP